MILDEWYLLILNAFRSPNSAVAAHQPLPEWMRINRKMSFTNFPWISNVYKARTKSKHRRRGFTGFHCLSYLNFCLSTWTLFSGLVMCSERPLYVYCLVLITDKDPPRSKNIECENMLLSSVEKSIYNTHQHGLLLFIYFPSYFLVAVFCRKSLTVWKRNQPLSLLKADNSQCNMQMF